MTGQQRSRAELPTSDERSNHDMISPPGAGRSRKRRQVSDPLVVAIFAAAAAGGFNVLVSLFNNQTEQSLESLRADNALIVEAIKTGPAQAKTNLLFLAENHLLSEKRATDLKKALTEKGAVAPSIPAVSVQSIQGGPSGAGGSIAVYANAEGQMNYVQRSCMPTLVKAGYTVAGPFKDPHVPRNDEVKFFGPADQHEAKNIGDLVKKCGLKPPSGNIMEISPDPGEPAVQPRYFELWIGSTSALN